MGLVSHQKNPVGPSDDRGQAVGGRARRGGNGGWKWLAPTRRWWCAPAAANRPNRWRQPDAAEAKGRTAARAGGSRPVQPAEGARQPAASASHWRQPVAAGSDDSGRCRRRQGRARQAGTVGGGKQQRVAGAVGHLVRDTAAAVRSSQPSLVTRRRSHGRRWWRRGRDRQRVAAAAARDRPQPEPAAAAVGVTAATTVAGRRQQRRLRRAAGRRRRGRRCRQSPATAAGVTAGAGAAGGCRSGGTRPRSPRRQARRGKPHATKGGGGGRQRQPPAAAGGDDGSRMRRRRRRQGRRRRRRHPPAAAAGAKAAAAAVGTWAAGGCHGGGGRPRPWRRQPSRVRRGGRWDRSWCCCVPPVWEPVV